MLEHLGPRARLPLLQALELRLQKRELQRGAVRLFLHELVQVADVGRGRIDGLHGRIRVPGRLSPWHWPASLRQA